MNTSAKHLTTTKRRHRIARVVIGGTVSAIVALSLSACSQAAKAAGPAPTLQTHAVAGYGEVLANSAGYSLYVLSTESAGMLRCTSGACLASWPPLLVAKNSMITAGSGVSGKISHVTRGSKWQVTYNGWPVYSFNGDSGPGQSNGEKLSSFGGTWYLAGAAATTNPGTPVKAMASGSTTSTTAASGGY
jgi:predicted lipoprotein with Yx(FWY)xxD motif